MNFKKGDNVIVVAGGEKGKKGKILKVFNDANRVLVEGINIKKKHQRARKSGEKGQILEIATPVNASNVMILDPKGGKPTRIGKKIINGKQVRVARKSGTEL